MARGYRGRFLPVFAGIVVVVIIVIVALTPFLSRAKETPRQYSS
jgi:hypothetical protein